MKWTLIIRPLVRLSLDKWSEKHPSDTIIVTDFIASTPENIPTTLKRDGNDFSIAIMGALFLAKKITIWTYVDGVTVLTLGKGTHCCFTRLNYHRVLQYYRP
jgi:hypothetical protein